MAKSRKAKLSSQRGTWWDLSPVTHRGGVTSGKCKQKSPCSSGKERATWEGKALGYKY
jgi:hypothetical protein